MTDRRPETRRLASAWRAALLAVALAAPLQAQGLPGNDGPSPTEAPAAPTLDQDRIRELHEQAVDDFQAKRYNEALEALRTILESDPGDEIALYNAACVQTALGELDKAVSLLEVAILNGFVEFEKMKRDPDLEPLRNHPKYIELLGVIDGAYADAAEQKVEYGREALGRRAIVERDDDLRLIFAASLRRDAFDAMRATIRAQWDYQIKHLFDAPPDAHVLLMIPSAEQVGRFLPSSAIGGYYDHDRRTLLSREIGPSLRHEITHALHHAQMDRLGQKHPMWVQEGLASVFELYEFDEQGRLIVLDNSRLNIAVNLCRSGSLTPWEDLFAESPERFTHVRANAKYAEARAIFQYLAERGLFERWYRAYLDTFPDDPTGAKAFETVFDLPLEEIEREFRLWLREKPKVPMKIPDDWPSIGVWVADQEANDGVRIVGVREGGAAERARLFAGEIITAVDGQPVYAVEELLHEIASRAKTGGTVTLTLRRAGRTHDVEIRLSPVPEPRGTVILQEPGVAI